MNADWAATGEGNIKGVQIALLGWNGGDFRRHKLVFMLYCNSICDD